MPVALQTVWILAALGAAVFAVRSTGFSLCTFALGFAGPIVAGYSPVTEQVGTLAGLAAGISLFLPRWQALASFFGGIVAGALVPLIAQLGPPMAVAVPLAATIPALTLWLTRNPNFAPAVLLDEALLLLLLLGLGAAVVPPVVEGWQTARGMNGTVGNSSGSLPAWVLLAGGASLAFGSAWSVWSAQGAARSARYRNLLRAALRCARPWTWRHR